MINCQNKSLYLKTKRPLLILIITLGFYSFLQGQDVNDIYFVAEKYLAEKKYELAIKRAKTALKIAEIQFGKDSTYTYQNTLELIRDIYSKTDLDSCFIYAQKIKNLFYDTINTEDTTSVIKYFVNNVMIAEIFESRNLYDSAENLYLKNFETSERVSKSLNYDIHYQHIDNLFQFYNDNQDYIKAERLAQDLLEIKKIKFGKKSPEYILQLLDNGFIYRNIGKYSIAIENYLNALKVLQNPMIDSINTAIALDNLGVLYSFTLDYKNSEKALLEAMDIFEKTNYKNHLAINYNNLGLLNINLENYESAEDYFLKAVEIHKLSLIDTTNFRTTMENLSSLYLKMNQVEESEQIVEDYKRILENREGAKSENIRPAISWYSSDQIAQEYYNQGKFLTALERAKFALSLIPKDEHDSINFITTLTLISDIFNSINNDSSQYYAQIGLMKYKKSYGGDNKEHGILYSHLLMNLANSFEKQNNLYNAELLYRKILQTSRKLYGDKFDETLFNLDLLFDFYYRNQMDSAAEKISSELLKKTKNKYGKLSKEYINLLSKVGDVFYANKNYREATKNYYEYINLNKELIVDTLKLASIYAMLGQSYYNQQKFDKAELSYLSALNNLNKYPEISEIDIALASGNLGMLYYQINDMEKSINFFSKSKNILKSYPKYNNLYVSNLEALYSIYKEVQDSIGMGNIYNEYKKIFPIDTTYIGIGVNFEIVQDTIIITNVIQDGPSQKAGLNPSDQIIKIDSKLVAGRNIQEEDVIKMLTGEKGSTVILTIKRKTSIRDIKVFRDKIYIK